MASDGEGDGEDGAVGRGIRRVNLSAMRLRDPLPDRQTQAGSFTGSRSIRPIEAIEDVRQIRRIDARSGVGHLQAGTISLSK
jgi:hypothetical protein